MTRCRLGWLSRVAAVVLGLAGAGLAGPAAASCAIDGDGRLACRTASRSTAIVTLGQCVPAGAAERPDCGGGQAVPGPAPAAMAGRPAPLPAAPLAAAPLPRPAAAAVALPAAAPVPVSAAAPADPPQADIAMPAPAPAPGRYRVEATVGYGQGNYDGRLRTKIDGSRIDVTSDSLLGSDGLTLSIAAWRDRTGLNDLSVGLEYLRFGNESRLKLSAPYGASIVAEPVEAPMRAHLDVDLAMLNVAYRPDLPGAWHPFVGAGIGGGYGRVEAQVRVLSPILVPYSETFRAQSAIGAVQGFFGFSADLSENAYALVMGRLVMISARPLGLHQQFQNMTASAGLGWRF